MKLKKVLTDMKNRKRECKNKVIAGTAGMMTAMFMLSTTVMAAGGVDSVTQPLTNLKDVGYQYNCCSRSHYPCKECHGVLQQLISSKTPHQ